MIVAASQGLHVCFFPLRLTEAKILMEKFLSEAAKEKDAAPEPPAEPVRPRAPYRPKFRNAQ